MYEDLTYDEQDHVGVITLRRPEARNALTFRTYAELEDAVRTTTARCLVITGADPAFCSGDDVKVVMGGGERPPDVGTSSRSGPRLTPAADALLHTDVPIVAAVNGAAVGWGMELSIMCDFRVASEKAKFGELFVLRGLVSDAPGLGRLAHLVVRHHSTDETDPQRLGVWVTTTLGELFQTEDHREGVRSFLEKRPPKFIGS